MSRTVYVVRRLSWDADDDGSFTPAGEDEPSGVPVRAFTTRKAAEAFRREAEEKARRAVSPGRFTGFGLTDARAFADSVRKLGLETPGADDEYLYGDELLAWWGEVVPNVTSAIREEVWHLLGDVPLYDVVKTTLED